MTRERPITLVAKDGDLYYPDEVLSLFDESPGPILLCVYDAGDCDSISWPNPNKKNLHRALFDDRETGLIDDEEVLLPDGTSAWAS